MWWCVDFTGKLSDTHILQMDCGSLVSVNILCTEPSHPDSGCDLVVSHSVSMLHSETVSSPMSTSNTFHVVGNLLLNWESGWWQRWFPNFYSWWRSYDRLWYFNRHNAVCDIVTSPYSWSFCWSWNPLCQNHHKRSTFPKFRTNWIGNL